MPARKRVPLSQATRDRIQVTNLVEMLQEYALTGLYHGKSVDKSRIKSAEILLRKVLPDLKQIDVSGQEGGPLEVHIISHAKN